MIFWMLKKKKGGSLRSRWLINGFRQVVSDAGLVDVFMEGYPFTWFKSLGTPRAVEERLDRALANASWFQLFPNAKLENLVAPTSDHYLILLTREPATRVWVPKKTFKFENAWCVEPGIHDVVSDSCLSSAGMLITRRLDHCAYDLSSWSKTTRNGLKEEIVECRKELNRCRDHGAAADPNRLSSLRLYHFHPWCPRYYGTGKYLGLPSSEEAKKRLLPSLKTAFGTK